MGMEGVTRFWKVLKMCYRNKEDDVTAKSPNRWQQPNKRRTDCAHNRHGELVGRLKRTECWTRIGMESQQSNEAHLVGDHSPNNAAACVEHRRKRADQWQVKVAVDELLTESLRVAD